MQQFILSFILIVSLSLSTFGQSPEGFKYQAVVRDASSAIIANQAIGMQISILQGSTTSAVIYQEQFASTTNSYGLVNLEIGSGTTIDDFTTIDWSNGPYFIKTAIDVTGGSIYVDLGISQLMSVPYALYAKSSGNGQGGVTTAGTNVTITGSGIGGDPYIVNAGAYTAGTGIDVINNVISAAEPTYTIGLWPELGGYVFRVSTDGKHGLVAETIDQGIDVIWYEAQNWISNPIVHSSDGVKFSDWRLPTRQELYEMYLQQAAIGSFALVYYWSSTEWSEVASWYVSFYDGDEAPINKGFQGRVRSVRAF